MEERPTNCYITLLFEFRLDHNREGDPLQDDLFLKTSILFYIIEFEENSIYFFSDIIIPFLARQLSGSRMERFRDDH